MPDPNNWNQRVITEFRANEGRVGGPFAGAPMILVHHVGRTSGKEYINPLVYLPGEGDGGSMYIFGSKAGAPTPRSPAKSATASMPSRLSACPVSATTRRRPRASARSRC